jgi:hypothetical protein
MWRGPLLAAMILAICFLKTRPRLLPRQPSNLARLETSFRPLLEELPPDAHIGFFSDDTDPADRLWASYVLAPRIVDPEQRSGLILCHTEKPPAGRLIRDFGRGWVLVEK